MHRFSLTRPATLSLRRSPLQTTPTPSTYHCVRQVLTPVAVEDIVCANTPANLLLKFVGSSRWSVRVAATSPSCSPRFPSTGAGIAWPVCGEIGGAVALAVLSMMLAPVLVLASGERLRLVQLATEVGQPA